MKRKETGNCKKTKGMRDVLLISVLLLCGLAGVLGWQLLRAEGTTVEVSVDGKTVATYSLSEDRTVSLSTGVGGEGTNVLRICDGKADVTDASCPDGICVDHHSIFREGETIVCLPNHMVVTICNR